MKRPEPLTDDQISKRRYDRAVKRPSIFSEKYGAGAELSAELMQLRTVVERIADSLDRIADTLTAERTNE